MSNASTIQAIIFDMDGVLTDSEPLINAAAVAMFREMGVAVQPADFLPFVGTGEDRYIGGVAEKHGVTFDPPKAKRRTYEIYLELVPVQLRAFPGAVELVRACKAAGFKVAVASSADLIKINANLNQIGLPPDDWDAIVSGDDVARKKPAPDIFLAAARKLGVEAAACTVIEDAVHGVEAAKAAGMRCVAVAQSFPAAQLAAADLVKERIVDIALEDLSAGVPAVDAKPDMALPTPPPLPLLPLTVPAVARTHDGCWGFWPTVGLSAVIFAAFLFTQSVVLVAYAMVVFGPDTFLASVRQLEHNGMFWALATFATTPVVVGLSWALSSVRKAASGISPGDYLGLTRVSGRTMLKCVGMMLAFCVAADGFTWLLGRSIVPEVMLPVYRSAGVMPVFWAALVVCAPLAEEVFFRGFMIPGLSRTRAGGAGAVVMSAAAWAAIHLQYDAYGIGIIFAMGLVIGAVRLKTGSIVPCIAMHAVNNLVATIQTAVAVGQAG